MKPVDLLYRTAVYVIRMYGGVGGEEPRGFPLSRLEVQIEMANPTPTSNIEWGNVAQWVGALATLCAVTVALFKEKLLRRWRRAKLSARILLEPPDSFKEIWKYKVLSPDGAPQAKQTNRYVFRLWVANKGSFDRAENVQVFANSLEKLSADSKTYIPITEFLPMNLVWSHTDGRTFLEAISANGMGKHCDLGHILNPVAYHDINDMEKPKVLSGKAVFMLDVEFKHFNKSYLLEPGTYRLHIFIVGQNALPESKIVEISFAGDWYEDQNKMFCDGVRINILNLNPAIRSKIETK